MISKKIKTLKKLITIYQKYNLIAIYENKN